MCRKVERRKVEQTGLSEVSFITCKMLIFNRMYLNIISDLLPLARKNL